jgi:hypothetical protein
MIAINVKPAGGSQRAARGGFWYKSRQMGASPALRHVGNIALLPRRYCRRPTAKSLAVPGLFNHL